ncbi:MAG: copper resistance protein CopC [Candidatus Rokubacteria bacterium]|nr:copper resistance protein CopC [Candidatus Rokubacteria bacterium]
MGLLRGLIAAALFLPAVLAGMPRLAAAHALVLESSPRSDEIVTVSPQRIFLRFNSRLEKALSRVTLIGPAGRPVPLPVAAPDLPPNYLVVPVPPIESGQYLVRWKVLSADGHVTEGAFRFSVAP